jgi:hypothetical protein
VGLTRAFGVSFRFWLVGMRGVAAGDHEGEPRPHWPWALWLNTVTSLVVGLECVVLIFMAGQRMRWMSRSGQVTDFWHHTGGGGRHEGLLLCCAPAQMSRRGAGMPGLLFGPHARRRGRTVAGTAPSPTSCSEVAPVVAAGTAGYHGVSSSRFVPDVDLVMRMMSTVVISAESEISSQCHSISCHSIR